MKRILVLIAFALSLSACTTFTRTSEVDLTNSWGFDGRIQYIGQERGIANVHWQYLNGQHEVELSGPFGLGLTRLTGDEQSLRIKNSDIDLYGPAEQLMSLNLGWRAPLSALPYWLQGHPMLASTPTAPITNGVRFEELGWTVSATDFRLDQGDSRPYRLSLKSDQLQLNFIISQWQASMPENL
ncbi:MAG: outer membrane lipoprotein LolB [Gammaproteobacteria bacterium]|nr:outer membrane lipoprotein LolB [Gammaproteobacteria bacterium]